MLKRFRFFLSVKPFRPWAEKEQLMDWLWLLLFVGAWVLLQAVILPKLGVPT
jgi:hypothetical protein